MVDVTYLDVTWVVKLRLGHSVLLHQQYVHISFGRLRMDLRRVFLPSVENSHLSMCFKKSQTFNMCNSVVLPALSSPRKRSLACLFNRPSDARTSQTVQQVDPCQSICNKEGKGVL